MTDQNIPAALPEGWRLADHKVSGRVIVTNPTPDSDGHVYFVMTSPENTMGYDWFFCDPDELTYLDQGAKEAAPVKVGDVIESADDPRLDALQAGSTLLDRDDDAVTKQGEAWTGDGYIPIEYEGGTFGPWTVLHIPKGADQ